MPFSCPVCDNDEYNEEDGGFFCTECGTQSQEYIVQEASEQLQHDLGTYRHEVSQARGTEGRKKPKESLGRPWTLYEAYQIIILAQADSLITLGASEDLKDVVYTLWANYLSKLGVAFCSKEKIVPDVVEKYKTGRAREILRGTFQKPSNLKVQSVKESIKGKAAERKRKRSEGGTGVTQESENPIHPSNSVFMDIVKTTNKHSYQIIRQSARKSAQWMDIKKTITLCYLGLMLTNPGILPCDVVRWVYNGQVPFLSTSHLLPSDMVLSNYDYYLFSVERFTTDDLIFEVNKLRVFMDLKNMPSPDLTALASRFISDLYLPKEFCLFVQRLIKKIPFKWLAHKTTYRPYEVLALGYIVLALKIVFGLDNVSERRLSDYTQKLQSLLHCNTKLYNWVEWKKFWVHKQSHQFDGYQELNCDLSTSKLENLDQFLESYEKTNISKRRFSIRFTLTTVGRKERAYDPEFRKALSKPLAAAITENSLNMDKGQHLFPKSTKDMESFERQTVSHLIDVPFFERILETHSADIRCKGQELLSQALALRPKLVHYEFPVPGTKLHLVRHNSYLWLLNLASTLIDCHVLILDKTVVRLTEFFVLLSEGKSTKGLGCIGNGILTNNPCTRQGENGLDYSENGKAFNPSSKA
ncbi:hypothetical protein RRG08_060552 [Elysia crispata]|uniref:TATA box-binding protein-associated factor RNA polymerase I subunit B n=1 Tax=Elysia crispata TaxID=231223 RepID=A0AAE1E1G7_9GAST|nr:hypothetical protein RRG08_060552 [Elysia crispata]